MQAAPENFVDAIITDSPYGLTFMGKDWDRGVPGVPFWEAALRVAKPGAHMLAFGGTRTHHRLMCAIEDAGWEIRDTLMWVYGSGFPKSLDVSKAIDKRDGKQMGWFGEWLRKWREENNISQKEIAALFPSKTGGLTGCVANWELGFNLPTIQQFNLIRDTFNLPFEYLEDIEREVVGTRMTGIGTGKGSTPIMGDGNRDITIPRTDIAKQWNGWGTALKPAWEPIILCRKPLEGTVAENVQKWGTGALNIDGCRIDSFKPGEFEKLKRRANTPRQDFTGGRLHSGAEYTPALISSGINDKGRFPANLIHDGSDEVMSLFPYTECGAPCEIKAGGRGNAFGNFNGGIPVTGIGDSGSAARFFYTAKADTSERNKYLIGKPQKVNDGRDTPIDNPFQRGETLRKNIHPTVKPVDLLRYLCRLITPPGGLILDPFAGSGSTGVAAHEEGFDYILVEIEKEYYDIARIRNAQVRL
jgi:DNA modification methylase